MSETNLAGDRFDTMAADLLARHAICGDIPGHEAANLQVAIARLLRAVAPFASEASFAFHRPDGPGYLTRGNWAVLKAAYDEVAP